MAKRENDSDFISITGAQSALSQDQSKRARRYFISMMVRTACFILTIILPSPFRWIALFGAVVLPYISVVVANAGRENSSPGTALFIEGQKSIG